MKKSELSKALVKEFSGIEREILEASYKALEKVKFSQIELINKGFWAEANVGICAIFVSTISEVTPKLEHPFVQIAETTVLRALFRSWPKYSGYLTFPITIGPDYEHAATSYHKSRRLDNLIDHKWHHDTEYGNLRWELLNYCIESLEAFLYDTPEEVKALKGEVKLRFDGIDIDSINLLLSTLKSIKNGQSKLVSEDGLCRNTEIALWRKFPKVRKVIPELCAIWPDRGPSTLYPVYDPKDKNHPSEQFYLSQNKWDKRTRYGKLRWKLLDFCIDCVEMELRRRGFSG